MSKHGNLKRGDTRGDGKIFYRYDYNGIEYWYNKKRFDVIVNKTKKEKIKYYCENKKQLNEKLKIWRKSNHLKVITNRKKYYNNNKTKILSLFKKRCDLNPVTKLSFGIRNLINGSFKRNGFTKNSKTMQILGCSFDEFKSHIESQFKHGMSWDNRSEWHIDHIMPVSMAKTHDEVIRLNHFRNLRPLWAHENLSKSDKTPDILVLFCCQRIQRSA